MSEFYSPKQQALLEAARKAQRDPSLLQHHEAALLKESGMDPAILAQPLTAAELQAVDRKREALRQIFNVDDIKATYKIEINFGKDRSVHTHFPGSIMVLKSGSVLGGGGDESMFFCPDNHCGGVIPQQLVSSMLSIAFCPRCSRQWPQSLIPDTKLFRLDYQKWATVITRIFIRLNQDADLYLKTHKVDLRLQTEKERTRFRGGEDMDAARRNRVRVIYSLPKILKDLSNGAEIEQRFLQFVRA